MKEKSFESRRVRTHPWSLTESIGAALWNASLIEVVRSCVILKRATLNAQRPTFNFQRVPQIYHSIHGGAISCPFARRDQSVGIVRVSRAGFGVAPKHAFLLAMFHLRVTRQKLRQHA